MKKKITKTAPTSSSRSFDWPTMLVTVLIGAAAFGVVAAQFQYANDPQSQLALANLDDRASKLEQTTNLLEHEGVGLSVYGHELDSALDPHARVFLTGMVGISNAPVLGYYFFLRHYLFPRDLEISLNPVKYDEVGFEGRPCESPEALKTNGFDLMIYFKDNQMQLIPLTPKGVPKQE